MEHSDITVRERNLSSTEKCHNDDCAPDCVPLPPPPSCPHTKLEDWTRGYQNWGCLGVHAFSMLSLGVGIFSLISINGAASLLSVNSAFSLMSLNSFFSILSTNSSFSIGCVDKRFAICFSS